MQWFYDYDNDCIQGWEACIPVQLHKIIHNKIIYTYNNYIKHINYET